MRTEADVFRDLRAAGIGVGEAGTIAEIDVEIVELGAPMLVDLGLKTAADGPTGARNQRMSIGAAGWTVGAGLEAIANILAAPLKEHRTTEALLEEVQQRRTLPMRVIQWLQIQIQNNVLSAVLGSTERPKPPFAAKFLNWFPALRRIPARLIGLGIRPEHIHTPEAKA